MKIIKHAKKEAPKKCRTFKCGQCGCEFQAEEGEYWEKPQCWGTTSLTYSAQKTFMSCCPECHKVVEDSEYDSNLSITVSGKLDRNDCTIAKESDLVTKTVHHVLGKTESSFI